MLCKTCQSIDFDAANCSPEVGGAVHQPSFADLTLSATNGCQLCEMIRSKAVETSISAIDAMKQGHIACNIWNWYDGPADVYKGSSTIVFYGSGEGSTWSAVLGISVDGDSLPALTGIISGRRSYPTANSEHCYNLAKGWIEDCLGTHQASCPHDAKTSLPTRVIDVGLDKDSMVVKVLETKGLQGVWVALSHCWGRVARFVTETSNLHERTEAIELSDLPLTFLDAIRITRGLGYRYLWIDSLCILQDSHQDWVDESGRMQDYYSKAILTVASDLATGDHESFLDNPRPQDTSIRVPFNSKASIVSPIHVYITRDVKTPGTDADATPLSDRGWTLQEDILSPRSLHYTTTQLIFECQQSRFVETDATPQGYNDVDQMRSIKRFFLRPESGLNDPLLLKFPSYEPYYQPINRWYRLFENYCARILTFESDRLAAIAGLAKEIQRQTKFSYRAGIWEEDIHRGLLWVVNGRGCRPEKYRAPSWTWAGLDIGYYDGYNVNPNFELYMLTGNWGLDPNSETCRRAEVLGCEVQTANGDPFGPVIRGELRMTGYSLPLAKWKGAKMKYINVWWRPIRSHQRAGVLGGMRGVQADDQLVCDLDIDHESNGSSDAESDTEAQEEPGEDGSLEEESNNEETDSEIEWRSRKCPPDVVLFQIQRHVRPKDELGEAKALFFCLMLEPTDPSNNCSDYQRVGIAEVPDINGLGHDGWEKRDVVIV